MQIAIISSQNDDRPPAAQGFLSNNLTDLRKIHEPDINIVLVRRPKNRDLQSEILQALKTCEAFRNSFLVDIRTLSKDLKGIQKVLMKESSFQSPLLFSDLERLFAAFHISSQSYKFTLRLDANLPYGCTLFHADYNEMRLLCTYVGFGTEWLKDRDVDRSALGTSNEKIVKSMARIQRIPPLWVSLMRGERYPGGKGKGLVHKSPDAKSKNRLIIAIDPLPNQSEVSPY